jgi:PmbA protein
MSTLKNLQSLLESFRTATIEQAEFMYVESRSIRVAARDRKIENIQESRSRGLGIRALGGGRMAFTYTNDLSAESLHAARRILEETLAVSEPDEHHALASPADTAQAELELSDDGQPDVTALKERVRTVEAAGLAVEGIAKVEATAEASTATAFLLNTNGVVCTENSTRYGQAASAHAHKNGLKEVAWSHNSTRHQSDLMPPEGIGREAALWSTGLLGSTPLPSKERPVVFLPQAAEQMLGYYAAALDGEMVNLGATFMVGKVGERVGSELANIVEVPHLRRGAEATLWDGEGVPTRSKDVVQGGVLKCYFHNLYSAHKSGAEPQGNATRGGYSSLPGIGSFNLHVSNGQTPFEELIADIDDGLLVYYIMGHGPDMASGTFSAGVKGWHIENGKVAKPVGQVTVSGSMLDLLGDLECVADDLDLMRPYSSPSLRIKKMAVSGT